MEIPPYKLVYILFVAVILLLFFWSLSESFRHYFIMKMAFFSWKGIPFSASFSYQGIDAIREDKEQREWGRKQVIYLAWEKSVYLHDKNDL